MVAVACFWAASVSFTWAVALATVVFTPFHCDWYLRRARSASAVASITAASFAFICACHFCASSSGPAPFCASPWESCCWYLAYSSSLLDLVLCGLRICRGSLELRLQLPDLVFIRTTVELEQRLSLLHRNIRFHQHSCHQGRLRQARNKLNRVLHHFYIRRIGGNEAQADHKDEEDMKGDKERDDSPGHVELQPLVPEEHQVDENNEYERDEESDGHDVGPRSATRPPLRTSVPLPASLAAPPL